VTTRLQDELRQRKPFGSLCQEAFLNVARTDAVLRDGVDRVLAPYELSLAQYNVLRILRGAGPHGLCRNAIRDRLLTRMPDVSRLLDRMEGAGLVSRIRSTDDRRLVNTTLTEHGRALVDELDDAVTREHEDRLGHLTEEQLRTLIELATLARARR
jgi:DNA-binding MarR family transcriptional regulator